METLWAPWRHDYITRQHRDSRKGVPAGLAGWPGLDTGCVFCNMLGAVRWAVMEGMEPVQAEREARILRMDTTVFLCMNAFPYNSGHLMVVPYEHAATLAELPESTAAEMMRLAQLVERSLRTAYRPDGLNLGANIGEAAGAGVAGHLHLHALPRWAGDTNFMTTVGETRVLPESLDTTWEKLRPLLSVETTRDGSRGSNKK